MTEPTPQLREILVLKWKVYTEAWLKYVGIVGLLALYFSFNLLITDMVIVVKMCEALENM